MRRRNRARSRRFVRSPSRSRAAASPARACSSRTARWQPSRRRFPTVGGTIVRRTPLRLVVPQRRHFHLDDAPPVEPVRADWMLGGFLLLRRAMLDELGGFDEGFRLYGEDIDLQYRAAARRMGAVVRPRRRRPARAPGGHRQELAEPAHALALGRDRPVRAQASRTAACSVKDITQKYDRLAERYSETDYADAPSVLPPAEPSSC